VAVVKSGPNWAVVLYRGGSRKREWFGPRRQIEEFGHVFTRAEAHAFDERQAQATRTDSESVSSFAGRWVRDFPRARATTNETNAAAAKQIAAHFAERKMRSVSRSDAREFVKERPYLIAAARAMFNDALDEEIVEANPFARLGQKQSRGRRDLEILRPEEIDLLASTALKAFSEEPSLAFQIQAMVLTAAYTGVRPGELYALEWTGVDFAAQTLRVDWRYDRKGRRERPKNGEPRTIYLPPRAANAIRELTRDPRTTLLFPNSRGEPYTISSFNHYWRQLRSSFEAKLDTARRQQLQAARRKGAKGLELYELRHFCGWYFFNVLALPAEDCAIQLGHTDGGHLVRVLYGHRDKAMARERMRQAFAREEQEGREAASG
jgi:integrase